MALTIQDKTRTGSGRSAARLARLLRKQEVGSSNLPAPTNAKLFRNIRLAFWVSLFSMLSFYMFGTVGSILGQTETPATYKVVSGDNLTFIAKRFGITLNNLRRSNHFKSDVLSIGQEIRIPQPFQLSAPQKHKWKRPCRKTGKILRPFGKYKEKNILMARTGVDLAFPTGSELRAPATAIVRYIGPLDGFGTVLILEHFDGYTTVFSPLDAESMKVREGSAINQGHLLGRTGEPVLENSPPYLHIELRKDQVAIKPKPLHP